MQHEHISLLERVIVHSVDYRTRFADVSASFSQGLSPQQSLFELLIATSELYLDCLLVLRVLPSLHGHAVDGAEVTKDAGDASREMHLRQHLRGTLDGSRSWSYLDLKHPLAEDNLATQEDYINNYALHLPEIHEETYQVEQYARDFIQTRNNLALVDLEIGLRHLAFNHAIFVLPALQWPSTE